MHTCTPERNSSAGRRRGETGMRPGGKRVGVGRAGGESIGMGERHQREKAARESKGH